MVLTRNARGDEPSPQVAGPSGRQPPASPRSRRRAARIPVLIRPRHSDSLHLHLVGQGRVQPGRAREAGQEHQMVQGLHPHVH